ncbi:hypothetical protein [Deinococcus detaillensis]|uniref:hypothetical protein n=1 Tax=Deinococcus detaillensis TaxID=2592048 RepID=UPI00163D7BC7|nr:hypothetical protein [Deinococcus detaillensis]
MACLNLYRGQRFTVQLAMSAAASAAHSHVIGGGWVGLPAGTTAAVSELLG